MEIDNLLESHYQDDNMTIRTWTPTPNSPPTKRADLASHDVVMNRLDMIDQDRGIKVAGHRGFFLVNDGVDLNQAMINYGLDFLRQRKYKKMMTPFMMRKSMMAKTAQLEEFDEALYRVGILIARCFDCTICQPRSSHAISHSKPLCFR